MRMYIGAVLKHWQNKTSMLAVEIQHMGLIQDRIILCL